MTFEAYLADRRRTIDEALDRWLPAPPDCPAPLAAAMRYSVMAGGKRLRPILTLAMAEAVAARHGGTDADARRLAMPAAAALEFIHTYSLIHDDLPAMDDDTLRRGRPTLHVVHGEGLAILAGDGLQALAFSVLAGVPREDTGAAPADRRLRTIALVARAAGAAGMVGGQAIDLAAVTPGGATAPQMTQMPQTTPPLDAAALEDMHARKTGALIRAAAVAGAVMAGGDDAEIDAADRYAAELGLAFQITDDILDVEGQSTELGKTAGKDAAAGKPTYPSLYGLEKSRALAHECLQRAEAAVVDAGLDASRLVALARWLGARRA